MNIFPRNLPPINFRPIIELLKKEGREELTQTAKGCNLVKSSEIFKEWDTIIKIMETEVIPLLAKGCESAALKGPVQKLLKSVGKLSLIATEVLSFIPGPVGIISSIILAIVRFSAGDILGGIGELIGAIPGFKAAFKGAKAAGATGKVVAANSKLMLKFESLVKDLITNNKALDYLVKSTNKAIKTGQKISESTKEAMGSINKFLKKNGKTPDVNLPPGSRLDTGNVGMSYGPRDTGMGKLEQSLRQPLPGKNSPKLPPETPPGKIDSSGTVLGAQQELGKYRVWPSTYGQLNRPNPFGL